MTPEFFGVLRLLSKKENLRHKNKPPIEDDRSTLEKDQPLIFLEWGTLVQSDSGQGNAHRQPLTIPTSRVFSKLMIRYWENTPRLRPSGEKPKGFCSRGPGLLLKDTFGGYRSPSKLSHISFSPPASPLCPTQLSHSLSPIVFQTSLPS